MPYDHRKSLILFDGICNLCNASVQFILKRDLNRMFIFASLQSDAAKKILLQYNYKKYPMNSILLVEDGKIYEKSTAALKICRHLSRPWSFFAGLSRMPLAWRDEVYDYVAKNRYRWFGRKESCTLVIPAYKNRFI